MASNWGCFLIRRLTVYSLTDPEPTVILSKVNSTSVRVDVALNGRNFDIGNVSFSPAVTVETFAKEDIPVMLSGLTSGVDYNLSFVFGVGETTNCGASGKLYSSPAVVEYNPGIHNFPSHYRAKWGGWVY